MGCGIILLDIWSRDLSDLGLLLGRCQDAVLLLFRGSWDMDCQYCPERNNCNAINEPNILCELHDRNGQAEIFPPRNQPLAPSFSQLSAKGPRVPFPVVHSLPGFSGCWQDSGRAQTPTNVDELADLTILGGRLQKEKMKIQQESRAQRAPVIAVRTAVLTLV